jgi:hypothetical protein
MIKLPTIRAFSLVVITLIAAVIVAQAQAKLGGKSPAIKAEIDTGDSPVGVARLAPVNETKTIEYGYYNKSGKPIRGFVVVVRSGESQVKSLMTITIARPTVATSFFDFEMFRPGDAPTWSFDSVLFADGTTWGPDKYARSATLLSTGKGMAAAFDMAGKLGLEPSPSQHVHSSSMNEQDAALESPTTREAFDRGYQIAVNWLSHTKTTLSEEAFRIAIERLKESRDGLFAN